MSSLPIIEDLNILKDRFQGILMTLLSLMIYRLSFHNSKKTGPSHYTPRAGFALPAVSFAGHALDKLMFFEFFTKIAVRILHTTIRVKYQVLCRTTPPGRPFERHNHHFMVQRAAQRASDYWSTTRSKSSNEKLMASMIYDTFH